MGTFVVLHQTEGGDFVWLHKTELGAYRSAAEMIVKEIPHFNDNIHAVIVGDVLISDALGKELKAMFEREQYKEIVEKWNNHWHHADILQEFFIEEQEVGD